MIEAYKMVGMIILILMGAAFIVILTFLILFFLHELWELIDDWRDGL